MCTLKLQAATNPLHLAAENGRAEVVGMLLNKDAILDSTTEVVTAYRTKNGQTRAPPDDSGHTPLHLAAENGHAEVVSVLLERGASVDLKVAGSGKTALRFAAESECPDTTLALLVHGADVEIGDCNDWTPLFWAERRDKTEIAKVLKSWSAWSRLS